ncbi:hypothetical protein CAI21_20465, partial [Alkalilimnicola ehrlichii]
QYPAHAYTDGYIAPEALQQNQPPEQLGEAQDRFALAVILFQLLNQGIHPYQGVPKGKISLPATNGERIKADLYPYGQTPHERLAPSPWSVHKQLHTDIQTLFDRSFTPPHAERPSAAQWTAQLRSHLAPGPNALKHCPQHPEQPVFGDGCAICTKVHPAAKVQKNDPRPLRAKGRSIIRRLQALSLGRQLALGIAVLVTLNVGGVLYHTHDTRQLRNPDVYLSNGWESMDGRGQWVLEVSATRPSRGSWQLTAFELNGVEATVYPEGPTVDGRFRIVPTQTTRPGQRHTARAMLEYKPNRRKPVRVFRQWPVYQPNPPYALIEGVDVFGDGAHFLELRPQQTFSESKLGVGAMERLGRPVFTQTGDSVLIRAFSRQSRNGQWLGGPLLSFDLEPDDSWQLRGALLPPPDTSLEFGEAFQISSDGQHIAVLACEYATRCDQVHFFGRQRGEQWKATSTATLPFSWEGDPSQPTLALSGNGLTLAAVKGNRIHLLQYEDDEAWTLVQSLPLPEQERTGRFGAAILTNAGDTLYVIRHKAPADDRVLVYERRPDGKFFPATPVQLALDFDALSAGQELVMSGDEQTLAFVNKRRIHLFERDGDRFRKFHVVDAPLQFLTSANSANYYEGFSLSFEGQALLTGPNEQTRTPFSDAPEIMLYKRQDDEYAATYRINLAGLVPSGIRGVSLSPNGHHYVVSARASDPLGAVNFYRLPSGTD